MRKIITTLAVFALTISASILATTKTALEHLCYVKAEDSPVAYHAEAIRLGISKPTLRKLENSFKCDGVLLGEVENNWTKQNP